MNDSEVRLHSANDLPNLNWEELDGLKVAIDSMGDVFIDVIGVPPAGVHAKVLEEDLRSFSRKRAATRHSVHRLGSYGYAVTFDSDLIDPVANVDISALRTDFAAITDPDDLMESDLLDQIHAATADETGTYVGMSLALNELGLLPFSESCEYAPAEDVVMVIGPPRSGKTIGVINPNILFARGPVVSTSTKPDVLNATAPLRRHRGQVWVYDPTGKVPIPSYARRVNWTPIDECGTWDSARAIAKALMEATTKENEMANQSYWVSRAESLLAPLLRLANIRDASMYDVIADLGQPDFSHHAEHLRHRNELAAAALLDQLGQTAAETRGSITSTAAAGVDAWAGSDPGYSEPPFDTARFVRSTDTVYVVGSGFDQAAIAPAIAGFVSTLARATYAHWTRGEQQVLFALDEVANIAPIGALPSIMSEGGGQGVQLILCFQDFSQIRSRWGLAAKGFATLARNILLLPGVRDIETLAILSALAGRRTEYQATKYLVENQMNQTVLNPVDGPLLPMDVISELKVPSDNDFRALLFNADGWQVQQLPAAFSAEDLALRMTDQRDEPDPIRNI